MPIGFRIGQRPRVVSTKFVEEFAQIPVAIVSDSMMRMSAGGARLRPFHRGSTLAGAALTVRTRPGDNLMFQKAIDMAVPGDVIVVDGGGDVANSLCGELMVNYAIQRQVAGFVVNGAIRDLAVISAGDFPVFAVGVTHRGPYKAGPGEINFPIAIDGMVIQPGALVLGDQDGVISVSIDDLESVLYAAHAKQKDEAARLQRIAAGKSDRAWVDTALRKLGCEF